MKKLSKFLAFVLTLALCLSFTTPAFAANSPEDQGDGILRIGIGYTEPGITPYWVDVCNGYRTHAMYPKFLGGACIVDPNTGASETYINYPAPCWQCSRCNLVMITEGESGLQPIGKYATWVSTEQIPDGNQITIIYTTRSLTGYTSSKTLEGYSWNYTPAK